MDLHKGCFHQWRQVGLLFLFASVLFLVHPAMAAYPIPCNGCSIFNPTNVAFPDQREQQQGSPICRYPCQCAVESLECQMGVNVVKDGCGCCYMCARQLADVCSVKDVCDKANGLYCSTKGRNATGTCLGHGKKPCKVKGAVYQDGEKFYMGCSKLCTCQNGFFGCSNLCPQELSKPSELTCHEPKLIKVKDKCCREWTCQKLDTSGQPSSSDKGLESQALVMKNPMWYRTSTARPSVFTTAPTLYQGQGQGQGQQKTCKAVKSDWSQCSVTCGVGVSLRRVVDKATCKSHEERQLCYFRPCGIKVTTLGRDKCTPTTRTSTKQNIRFMDCTSVRPYKPKFCTNCMEGRCCYPKTFRTKALEFQCNGGTKEVLNYMWIKKCRCTTNCFSKKAKGWNKRRKWRNKRRRKDRRRRKNKKWRRNNRKKGRKGKSRKAG